MGLAWLIEKKSAVLLKTGFVIIFCLMTVKTIYWMYENHPYQYAYFNEVIGGVKGAHGYYDTDYQQLAASASFAWVMNSKQFASNKAEVKTVLTNNIAIKYSDITNGDSINFIDASFNRYTYRSMDFGIFSSIFLEKNIVMNYYPPAATIHIEYIGQVPVSAVVIQKNIFTPMGLSFYKNENADSAIFYLQKSYETDSTDYRIWPFIGDCYKQQGDLLSALFFFKKYRAVFPDDEMAGIEIMELTDSISKIKSVPLQ